LFILLSAEVASVTGQNEEILQSVDRYSGSRRENVAFAIGEELVAWANVE